MYGGSGTWPSTSTAASSDGAPELEPHEPAAEKPPLDDLAANPDARRACRHPRTPCARPVSASGLGARAPAIPSRSRARAESIRPRRRSDRGGRSAAPETRACRSPRADRRDRAAPGVRRTCSRQLPSRASTTSSRDCRAARLLRDLIVGSSKSKSETSMRSIVTRRSSTRSHGLGATNHPRRASWNDTWNSPRCNCGPARRIRLARPTTAAGVNFALFSEHATAVHLCLFEDAPPRRNALRSAHERTDCVWHGYMPGARPGQLYGFRVQGPWDPARGFRFNPAKVLLDPYARAIGRPPAWHPSVFGYAPGTEGDGAHDRQRALRAAWRRHQRAVRLAGRPAAARTVARHRIYDCTSRA